MEGILSLNEQEKISLWKQRFLESAGGLEDLVLGLYNENNLRTWMGQMAKIESRFIKDSGILERKIADFWQQRFSAGVKAKTDDIYEMFGSEAVKDWLSTYVERAKNAINDRTIATSNNQDPSMETSQLWKQRYFRSQATGEEYVLNNLQKEGLPLWVDKNSDIAAKYLYDTRSGKQSTIDRFMQRILQQLQLYDSKIKPINLQGAFQLANEECGILRYRKQAEQKGVQLTFDSPCDYCTELSAAIGEKYTGKKVQNTSTELGCIWSMEK